MICDRDFIVLERWCNKADPKLGFGMLLKCRGCGTIARWEKGGRGRWRRAQKPPSQVSNIDKKGQVTGRLPKVRVKFFAAGRPDVLRTRVYMDGTWRLGHWISACEIWYVDKLTWTLWLHDRWKKLDELSLGMQWNFHLSRVFLALLVRLDNSLSVRTG
jgi:hypothetical protein